MAAPDARTTAPLTYGLGPGEGKSRLSFDALAGGNRSAHSGRGAGAFALDGRGDVVHHRALLALARPRHRSLELRQGAKAERHGVARLDIRRVPVRAVAHRGDGGLGGADQLGNLAVAELRMVLEEPGDGVGLVLA